jgi:hypothetical protein
MGSRSTVVLLALGLSGCSDHGEADARSAFDRFQAALFAGDRSTVIDLLARESRPAALELDFAAIRARKPLTVTDASRIDGAFHLTVHDPAEPTRPGCYVVIREGGAWRVDLLASLSATRPLVHGAEPSITARPAELSKREIDKVEASSPAIR